MNFKTSDFRLCFQNKELSLDKTRKTPLFVVFVRKGKGKGKRRRKISKRSQREVSTKTETDQTRKNFGTMLFMSNKTLPFPYEDIVNCKRPTFPHRKAMSLRDRAAQFSPFSALRGYDEEISEVTRFLEKKKGLSEIDSDELNAKLNFLGSIARTRPKVTVTHYEADLTKEGGRYVRETKVIRFINLTERKLIFLDYKELSFDDIASLEGEVFEGLEKERAS